MVDSVENPLEDFVAVPREEYEELIKAQEFLEALESVGVDRWDGYELVQERVNW